MFGMQTADFSSQPATASSRKDDDGSSIAVKSKRKKKDNKHTLKSMSNKFIGKVKVNAARVSNNQQPVHFHSVVFHCVNCERLDLNINQ